MLFCFDWLFRVKGECNDSHQIIDVETVYLFVSYMAVSARSSHEWWTSWAFIRRKFIFYFSSEAYTDNGWIYKCIYIDRKQHRLIQGEIFFCTSRIATNYSCDNNYLTAYHTLLHIIFYAFWIDARHSTDAILNGAISTL